jgi:hypothetical protein
MAEVAPSAGSGGGGNRKFLLIIAALAALFILGALALGAIVILPTIFGPTQVAAVGATPTRISIPATPTRPPQPTATLVVVSRPTLAPGERRVILEVDASNNATLTTEEGGKSPRVQDGTWSLDSAAQRITFAFTELNGRTLPFTDEIVVQLQGTGFSVLSYNKALHGDLGEVELRRTGAPTNLNIPVRSNGVAFPNAQATATPDPLQGDYLGSLPVPTGNQRIYTLSLLPGGGAVFSTVETGKSSIVEIGNWQAAGDEITLNLTDKDGVPVQEAMVFELSDDELVGKTYDVALFGPDFILERDADSLRHASNPSAGTYSKIVQLGTPVPLEETATPIPITATPIMITATPGPNQDDRLPDSGAGEDMLLLVGGGVLLLGVIVVVRRMRSA